MCNKELINKIRKRFYGIKSRCYNENCPNYEDYGGRGIKICDEWLSNINNFINWSLENGFREDFSIDRIDVNGNYEPNNCRWVDRKIQANNKRDVVIKNLKRTPHSKVEEIALKTNRSIQTIYKLAKKFNRLPTENEVLNRKVGRPKKLNY